MVASVLFTQWWQSEMQFEAAAHLKRFWRKKQLMWQCSQCSGIGPTPNGKAIMAIWRNKIVTDVTTFAKFTGIGPPPRLLWQFVSWYLCNLCSDICKDICNDMCNDICVTCVINNICVTCVIIQGDLIQLYFMISF